MEEYKTILRPLLHYPLNLLELGIHKGGSLQYWDDFLENPETKIVGLDLELPSINVSDRVIMIKADQNDTEKLNEIAKTHGPFDFIIDDASHFAKETQNCWDIFWPSVKQGGYYVIEDWAVGYFEKSLPQYAGMVQVVTDIILNIRKYKIGRFRIIREKGKSMAFFQKKVV